MCRALIVWVVLAAAGTLGGCAGRQRPVSGSAEPVQGVAVAPVVSVPARSVEGRGIEVHRFGTGQRPVLVLAAIHGNERTTAHVAGRLVELLRRDPSVAGGVPVVVVPVANPDGLAAGTRVNANRVDLNRNFPAANWRPVGRGTQYFNGPAAASEPETRAIIRLVEELRPRRICSIHSIGQGRQQNNYDGPAEGLARAMSRHNGYPASATIGYATPGSFGSWAGVDRGIPVITLELPSRMPGEEAWAGNREAILAFVRGN